MEHLLAMLRSLIEQSWIMRDPGMLEKMPAGKLALFFGILFDRTIRMLELLPALQGGRGEGIR